MTSYIMLAYVESPFQYLQVIEYAKSKGVLPSSIHLLVRQTGIETNNNQIKQTIQSIPMDYRKVTYLSNWFFLIFYGWWVALNDGKKALSILIGDENSFFTKAMRCFFPLDRFVFLDDGTATLERQSEARRFSLFGQKPEEKNNFHYLANHLKSVQVGGKRAVVIVGAKFIESKISTLKEYKSYLSQMVGDLKRDHPNTKIIYVPHRYEGEHLPELKKEIFDQASIEVIRLQYPIELIRMELSIDIIEFISFFSTALFSLKYFYPDSSLCYYKIPLSKIGARKKRVELIYNALEESGIQSRVLLQ
ncbi:MAG: hypothetical protein R3A11_05470 [Bdellovibrionota bacterium]